MSQGMPTFIPQYPASPEAEACSTQPTAQKPNIYHPTTSTSWKLRLQRSSKKTEVGQTEKKFRLKGRPIALVLFQTLISINLDK
ncbi:Hypothetical predicted protein [Marmota monax]|uniref:Uncharacterized protein n=2 Tax=Marmota monax TaxID=9995 RepID=A0A5E4B469_MARMO|nr:hypothetical protein GHT09_010248 [Marmota monax]VTJ64523.1 Hypothetical predicted protein [Marmota monax]